MSDRPTHFTISNYDYFIKKIKYLILTKYMKYVNCGNAFFQLLFIYLLYEK